jgi:hypothetical protein
MLAALLLMACSTMALLLWVVPVSLLMGDTPSSHRQLNVHPTAACAVERTASSTAEPSVCPI